MVPSNILQRTFHISFNGQTGTAFTIDVADRQYLVTAAHVISGLKPSESITVMRHGGWHPLIITDVWTSPTGADVALLSFSRPLSPLHQITIGTSASFSLSQQIYFLGFPYGLHMDAGQVNDNFPVPFVKTGVVSSFSPVAGGSQIIYCDGHNNPGFSGGPIVTVSPNHSVSVIGVVSGYRYNEDRVLLNGADTGLTYQANTGLIIGYGLKEVVAQASSVTTGAPLTQSA